MINTPSLPTVVVNLLLALGIVSFESPYFYSCQPNQPPNASQAAPPVPGNVFVPGLNAPAGNPSAAATCPAVVFQSAQSLVEDDSTILMGMRRGADGSFSGQYYTANQASGTVTQIQSTPNVQQAFINCNGLASRSRTPGLPNLKSMPLGVSSRNPVFVDLANDGFGALIGVWDSFDDTHLIVQPANFTNSTKSTFTKYAIGQGPAGELVADFNGDGKQDVAVFYTGSSPTGSSASGGVSILLGNGDGTLKTAVNYPTSANAITGTAFDFNGDGKPDLAVGHYSNVVTILVNNGDGTFRAGSTYKVGGGQNNISAIVAADVNGDHIGDLLILTAGNVWVMFGKGDGTFTNGALVQAVPYGTLATGDFNRDGFADLAVSDGSGTVYIYTGAGNGTFSVPVAYAASGSGAMFAEDFDGDGFVDLVFSAGHPDALTPTEFASSVSVLFGNGDGTFASGRVYQTDFDTTFQQVPSPTILAVADLNGDGKPDFATANPTAKSVSVALSTGNGTFKSPSTITLTAPATSIATGAFSGDGKADIVVTDGASHIQMLFHNGDGTFQHAISYPTGGTTASFVVAGDFNGDKKLDVAVANSGSNNIAILPGFGDSSFNNPVLTTVGPNPIGVVAADFNGDGKLDLAVANGGTFSTAGTNLGSVSVLIGKGDGTFQPAVMYAAYQYPVSIAAADVNGDGKLDLVIASQGANGNDKIVVLPGTGTGTFQAAVMSATSTGVTWASVGDFNGDGRPDLAVSHCCFSGTIAAMVGNGDGTFQTELPISQGSYSSSVIADVTADGKPDLLFTGYLGGSGRSVMVYKNITVSQGSLVITSAAGNPIKAPPIAPFSIATAKGTDLATGTLVNTAANPPTTLLNTTATVQDAAGTVRPAQLFYVSPGQVNFLIPSGTSVGNATVTITSGDGFVSVGTVAIAAIAPSIFTLNSNSLAAAYVQRVHGDLTQSIENLYAVDGSGNVTYPGIDLGPATDQVYINMFGTGIQGRSDLSAVVITVGGVTVPALYASASTYPGEDQVAFLLPRSLIGAGTVNVTLSANGVAANVTTLNIK
jgi:uncharacterized protein (TIGR03437 family)